MPPQNSELSPPARTMTLGADLRRHLQSLDPLGASVVETSPVPYPGALGLQTLKGYFGELLAGVCAELFRPFDGGPWKVPAYLFRFDIVAFQELERIRQGQPVKVAIPGRPGDDCLAFRRAADGHISATLICEAKCTHDHDAGMIADAHTKVSDTLRTPVDLPQLIEILGARSDDDSRSWANALSALLLTGQPDHHEAFSFVL